MGRPSLRSTRRRELVSAFGRVLAEHGYAGATVAAVAAEAGVAPGLVHHYFEDKDELLACLLDDLIVRFRERVHALEPSGSPLGAYADAALQLGPSSDVLAARCWVGVLAEAVRNPALFRKVRRLLDGEIEAVRRRSGGRLREADAGAVLAFVVGALVVGAFAPRKTAGFAAPGLHALLAALTSSGAATDEDLARDASG